MAHSTKKLFEIAARLEDGSAAGGNVANILRTSARDFSDATEARREALDELNRQRSYLDRAIRLLS